MFLLTVKDPPNLIVMLLIAGLIIGSFISWILIWPLSTVAEAFDYGVFRYLNNPVILHYVRGQSGFGEVFLEHLSYLKWGFHVGGTRITQKLVANVGVLLVTVIVATVTEACFG